VGLDKLAFVPVSSPKHLSLDAWATYGELIASDSRLVLLLDYEADTAIVPYVFPNLITFSKHPLVRWILRFTSVNSIEDQKEVMVIV
jgi:hypothetical protein